MSRLKILKHSVMSSCILNMHSEIKGNAFTFKLSAKTCGMKRLQTENYSFLFFFCFSHSLHCSLCFWRSRQSLKVREHKVLGPYVDGLSQLAVTNFEVCFFIFFYPSVITPRSWIHPVSLTKGLIFPTSTDVIYSTQQKCLYIISPVVKQLIYIWNKHLVSNPPKCWGSNDAYSSCGDAVMGFRVVCMPSLGRAFLN